MTQSRWPPASTLLALAAAALVAPAAAPPTTPPPRALPLGTGTALQPARGRPRRRDDRRPPGRRDHRAPRRGLEKLSNGGRPDLRRDADRERRDGVGAGASCPDQELAAAPASLPAMAASQLCLLNGVRADAGLPLLALDAKLSAAATAYAHDLVAGGYFSHTGRDGSTIRTRLDAVGYLPRDAGWAIGENLAWGTGPLATPGSIMQAWMNSPGHRENILNPDYREIGIGVSAGNPSSRTARAPPTPTPSASSTRSRRIPPPRRRRRARGPACQEGAQGPQQPPQGRSAAARGPPSRARQAKRGKGKKKHRGPMARIAI